MRSFKAAGKEAGDGRFYSGVHFQKANVDGFELGYRVARQLHTSVFKERTYSAQKKKRWVLGDGVTG
ncbi:hypothetical protein GPECTOR_10g841 [Gonium pectorale]|uniref:Phosphatidic acid phosphatase type 2/haloperoxidase domain-containing protein n=1 Tax=Gonium pectorale TaxID=33097 RepID=A0A150GSB3_GONPE|nr:hypothetical protein GPECTOR_10g841 [Gonium pectorale]|eukprot:KXZ52210.1 hypothetical protein GPECTOR_10g841 [Gonium pectorale]